MSELKDVWKTLHASIKNSHKQFEVIDIDIWGLKVWIKAATEHLGNSLQVMTKLDERLSAVEKKLDIKP